MQIYILSPNGVTLCALSSKGDALNSFNFYDSTFTMNLLTPNTFEFSCAMSHYNSKYIVVGNQVIFKYDGEYHLFKITEVEASHSGTSEARCYCEGASLELINSVVLPATMNLATAEQALNTVLTNTEWKVGEVDQFETKDIEFTSYGTVLSELTNLAELFGAEVKYRLGFNASSGITEKVIDFKHNIGRISGVRFEYGVNTTDVTRKVNSSNVCTAVIPIGNDDLTIKNAVCTTNAHGFDKPQGQIYVGISEEERSAITNSPYHIFATLNLDTDDPYKLAVKGWEYLQDNKKPYVEYTFNPVKLGEEVNIGDEVYCIDREMKIQIMATVAEYKINFNDSSQNSVTLKNFIPLESSLNSELYNQIQAQIKDANNVIIGGKPDTMGDGDEPLVWFDPESGEINIWDGTEWVETLDKEGIAQDLLVEVEDKIKELVAETKMDIYYQANQPAEAEDGQLWIDISTQPYTWKRWDAEKGEWEVVIQEGSYTKVEIDQIVDEVEGKIANTVTKNELAETNERLTVAESNWEQTAESITSKVSKDSYDVDMNAMNSRMLEAETLIQQNADAIAMKASGEYVNEKIDQLKLGFRNLYKNSDDINVTGVDGSFESYMKVPDQGFKNVWVFTNSSPSVGGTDIIKIDDSMLVQELVPNEPFTISLWVKGHWIDNSKGHVFFKFNDEHGEHAAMYPEIGEEDYTQVSLTLTLNDVTPNMSISCVSFSALYIARIKIERGSKATDWTPAFEDINSAIEEAQAEINVNKDNIELKVSKGDIVSTINQSAEGIKIKAELVEFDGRVTYSSLDDNLKGEIDSITTAITNSADANRVASEANNIINNWSHMEDKTMIDGGKIFADSINANKIDGGTLSGVDIYIDQDATIGETLTLGNGGFNHADIVFPNSASIATDAYSNMEINCGGDMTLRASGGNMSINPRPNSSTAGYVTFEGSYLENFWIRGTNSSGTTKSYSVTNLIDLCESGGTTGTSAVTSVSITGTGNTIANATFSNGKLTLEKLYRVNSHEVTGSGNAITGVSLSNGQMTFTKGSTFSTSGHNHTVSVSGSGNVVTGVSSSGGVITVTKGNVSSGSSFTGGTLSSTLYTRGVVPTSDSSYDLGSGSAYYAVCRADTMYSSNYANASDVRLKENVQDVNVEKCVKLINGLDIKQFDYIKNGKTKLGVMAQDLVMQDHYDTEDYFTEMIIDCDNDNEDLPLAVDYNQIVMPLIVTVQEQQKQIEAQQAQIDELKELVNQLLNK